MGEYTAPGDDYQTRRGGPEIPPPVAPAASPRSLDTQSPFLYFIVMPRPFPTIRAAIRLGLASMVGAAAVPAAAPAQVAFRADDSVAIIRSHRAALSLDPLSRVYACVDTLTVAYGGAPGDSASVRLHPAYTIVSFTSGGRDLPHRFSGGRLRWPRPGGAAEERLVLEFRGRIDFPSEYTRVGPDRAVLREEEILPWGPGILGPGRIALTVPAGWTVVAPGDREAAGEDAPAAGGVPGGRPGGGSAIGDRGTRTVAWSWSRPISGIGWICAGLYREAAAGTGGGRTLLLRAAGPDARSDTASESSREAAIAALGDSLLEFYSSAFTPYRHARLTVVEVDDWVAGWNVLALAAPGFIMVKRTGFVTDDDYNRIETILPHEAAHQWWMGGVVPRDRDAAFLSEGLCEYSSILYAEHSGGARSRDTLSRSPLLRPLIARVRRGTAVPLDTAVDIRSVLTQYLKGAYVHHMLRGTLGDAGHRLLLARFSERFEGRSASTADFRAIAEEVSGLDLGWFFAQWVSGTGLPSLRIYNCRSAPAEGGWRVTGRLRVVGYERHTADVTVEVRTAGAPARTRVRVGLLPSGEYANDVAFEVRTAGEPRTASADPAGDLLLLRRLPERLSDLRDPGRLLMIVGTGNGAEGRLRGLAAADSARFRAQGWEAAIVADTAVTLRDLQGDRVVLYGAAAENAALASLPEPFPIAPDGGAVTLDGETLRDSSLALVQAVGSPWIEDGLLVWVLPLSASARPELRPYDHSWALLRGREVIHSGTWAVTDDRLETPVRPSP